MQTDYYCNNCGKGGHLYHQCKMPITSIGVIVYRKLPLPPGLDVSNLEANISDTTTPPIQSGGHRGAEPPIQYLMIRRKDSLGHIDFMRGKYSVSNKHYIVNMLNQMTIHEKKRMRTDDFDQLWNDIWNGNSISTQYKNEEAISREKFKALKNGVSFNHECYTLDDLITLSEQNGVWEETEWGFPKGRRNSQEKDYDCAMREFEEETGYNRNALKHVQNIIPYEEIFTGSNYKSYKHKYYLMHMETWNEIQENQSDPTEVSKMEWKTYQECMDCIRDYNSEKKRLITRVHNALTKYTVI